MSKNYPKNPREEALERLLEATLESEVEGTPDVRDAVSMAEASGVMVHEIDAPTATARFAFANVLSAAALIIGLAALVAVLFGGQLIDQPEEHPKVTDSEGTKDQTPEESHNNEDQNSPNEGDDRKLDFAPIGYDQAFRKEVDDWPEVTSTQDLLQLIKDGETPTSLLLEGRGVTAQLLKATIDAFPKLEGLAIERSGLEDEDLDLLLGLEGLKTLSIQWNNHLTDPFIMQSWLLKLFPGEFDATLMNRLRVRRDWCRRLVRYSTDVEIPVNSQDDEPSTKFFLRLGAAYFDNYFKNVQALKIPINTFRTFLRDKQEENRNGLINLTPNLKHLTLIGDEMKDADFEQLAMAIRRRSFLSGDDKGLAARLDLESFTLQPTFPQSKGYFTPRGIGFLRDGKIFVSENLKSLSLSGELIHRFIGPSIDSLFPAGFSSLEELDVRRWRGSWGGYYSRSLSKWFGAIRLQKEPSLLRRLTIREMALDNFGARELLESRDALPNLKYLDLRANSISDPLMRKLKKAFDGCEFVLPEHFEMEPKGIRVLPFMKSFDEGTEYMVDSDYSVSLILLDKDSKVIRESAGEKVRLQNADDRSEFFPNSSFTKPMTSLIAYGFHDLTPGSYRLLILSKWMKLKEIDIEFDGDSMQEIVVEIERFDFKNKQRILAKNSRIAHTIIIDGKTDWYPGIDYAIVQGDKMLSASNYMDSYSKDVDEKQGKDLAAYYDYESEAPVEVLFFCAGLPLYRITIPKDDIIHSRPFRKHVTWDGEKWSHKDIAFKPQ